MFNFEEWFYALHKDKLRCNTCFNHTKTVVLKVEEEELVAPPLVVARATISGGTETATDPTKEE